MKDSIGEVHPAVVTGVSEAGAFVRLEDLYVEGLVRMQDLGSEYFAYDEDALTLRGERSRDVITFGARFEVEVLAVDLSRRQNGFLRTSALVKPGATSADAKTPKPGQPLEMHAAKAHKHAQAKPQADWSPRTDARPGPPPKQGKQQGKREDSRKERRKEHVDAHLKSANEKRARGQVDPCPTPTDAAAARSSVRSPTRPPAPTSKTAPQRPKKSSTSKSVRPCSAPAPTSATRRTVTRKPSAIPRSKIR